MSAASPASSKRKALIVISSGDTLPLSQPQGHPGLSIGFFLVELAGVLKEFEDDYDFVLATPDGRTPQLDINGMGLAFHGMENMGIDTIKAMVAQHRKDFDPAAYRAANPKLVARRELELELAYRYLGRLRLSQPLPKTDREAVSIRDGLVAAFEALPEREYLSLRQLIEDDDDPANPFSLSDFDFVHMPGGHAPMIDFHDNPWMGELLNRLYKKGILISLICHAPVAMTSAKYRVDVMGRATVREDHPFRGATVTTVPKYGELLALMTAYPKIPGQKTRLRYYVDEALKSAGYKVHPTLNPANLRLQWESGLRLLTGNGPQTIDRQAAMLRELLKGR